MKIVDGQTLRYSWYFCPLLSIICVCSWHDNTWDRFWSIIWHEALFTLYLNLTPRSFAYLIASLHCRHICHHDNNALHILLGFRFPQHWTRPWKLYHLWIVSYTGVFVCIRAYGRVSGMANECILEKETKIEKKL